MHGISPVDEDAIPVSYIYFLKGILLIQPQWDATPIDKDAIETIKVQGKESGLWFTCRKDTEPRNIEESVPIQRPPLTNSNSMWLLRKPLVEEPVEEPVAESVKPAAPARRERSMTTSSFWPARMNTKDELKELPCTPPKQVITKSPSPSRSSTSDGGQGKNFNYNYSQGWCDQNILVVTTETQVPIWLLNACAALEYITNEHPKAMSILSAILITAGSILAIPAIAAGAGGLVLASSAAQAAGAIAIGLGQALNATVKKTQMHEAPASSTVR